MLRVGKTAQLGWEMAVLRGEVGSGEARGEGRGAGRGRHKS